MTQEKSTTLRVDETTGQLRCGNCGASEIVLRRSKPDKDTIWKAGLIGLALAHGAAVADGKSHYCGVCGAHNWTQAELDELGPAY